MLTPVMPTVESINVDAMWNSVIDAVEEADEENASEDSQPAKGMIAKKVAADLADLRVSP